MIVTLKTSLMTATIDSLGAQLISLQDQNQTEYIWQRDPSYWGSCSPLLFPIVGNCRAGKTLINGRWYELPKHGFGRITEFSTVQLTKSSAAFSICSTAQTLSVYPYRFCLTLTYTLSDEGLSINYQVENTDDQKIYYQIGAHPGFNCPLKEGEHFHDYLLEFEKPETAVSIVYDLRRMQFDVTKHKVRLKNSRTLPLNYPLFAEDALFFDSLCSRKVTLKNPVTGNGVEVAFPDFKAIAFWTSMPSQGPFLCIEPWNGSAIRSDEDDHFLHRHALESLEPGRVKAYHLGIRLL